MEWVLLWCEKETSYSLVKNTDVIYENALDVGDTVQFIYTGKEYLGVVKGIDKDYDTLKKQQVELNIHNKKKVASFHENEPRAAASNSRAKISDIVNVLKPRRAGKKGKDGDKKIKADKHSLAMTVKASPRNSASDETIAASIHGKGIYTSSDSDSDLTPEQQALLAKIERKKARQVSLKELKSLQQSNQKDANISSHRNDGSKDSVSSSKPLVDISTENDMASKQIEDSIRKEIMDTSDVQLDYENPESATQHNMRGLKRASSRSPTSGNSKEQQKSGESESSDAERPMEPMPKKQKPTPPFHGIMFKYDDPNEYTSEDKKKEMFQELMVGVDGKKPSGIYVTKTDFSKARKYSKSAKQYARKLSVGIFSAEAMKKCTVSGDWYRAGGRDKMEIKPKLDEHAVETIIDAALYRQGKKSWTPRFIGQNIKDSLRQKLVEIRKPRKSVPAAAKKK